MQGYPIVHIELASTDPAKSATFYEQAFGWQTQSWPEMDYISFAAGDGPGGGFPRADGAQVKPGEVTVYVQADDIPGTLARIQQLGGKVIAPEMEIPGAGYMAVFEDPCGTKVALHHA